MAKSGSSEKRKRLMLAIVSGLFIFVLIYQFFLSGPATKPVKKPANSNSAIATTSPGAPKPAAPESSKSSPAHEQDRLMAEELANLTPLDLARAYPLGNATILPERGPIFAYWVAPPPPPPKQPDPPPIGLQGVQPQYAVAGTPRDITLTISGTKIPPDGQVYLDGNPRPTKRVNENQLSIELKAAEYASARSINIDVKSISDPVKNNSNTIQFMSQQAPAPQFRYIGRLGEYAVLEMSATKETLRLRRGDKVQGLWRIDSINDAGVELTHIQYEIKARVPMVEKPK